jgi:hypothetical protein
MWIYDSSLKIDVIETFKIKCDLNEDLNLEKTIKIIFENFIKIFKVVFMKIGKA